MSDSWAAVDSYLDRTVVRPDPVFGQVMAAAREAGLPDISVNASQGRFLHLLVAATGARRILEVGTLGGYSGIWMARALPPGGRLVSLEVSARHAEVARANFDRAGVGDRVEVREGPARESLPGLAQGEPFDLSFIDADKANNPVYFDWAVRLSRPGALIVVDNLVRAGRLLDESSADDDVRGVRRVAEMAGTDPRVTATALQTVGAKGWDGFLLARVN